jgi:hypothetical protein
MRKRAGTKKFQWASNIIILSITDIIIFFQKLSPNQHPKKKLIKSGKSLAKKVSNLDISTKPFPV